MALNKMLNIIYNSRDADQVPGAAMIDTEALILGPRVNRQCIHRGAPVNFTFEPFDQLPFLLKDCLVDFISFKLLQVTCET